MSRICASGSNRRAAVLSLVEDGELTPVQVDGGVGPENIRALMDAGATLFVAATAIFGREDLPRAYRRLVQALA